MRKAGNSSSSGCGTTREACGIRCTWDGTVLDAAERQERLTLHAFLNTQDEGAKECTDNQVICHGFKLNKQGYLPDSVLQFLTEHEQVPSGASTTTPSKREGTRE
jgi:hypothetical protein